MARTAQQSAQKPALDIDALVEKMYSGAAPEVAAPKVGLIRRTFEVTGNVVADSGDMLSEIGAGFTAAKHNYRVQREVALERQKARTKQRLLALMAQ